MEKSKRSIATLPWVKNKAKKFIPAIILLSLLTAVNSVGFVFLALVSRHIIDISTGIMSGNVLPWIIMLFGVILLQVSVSFASSYLKVRASAKFEMSLRSSLLESFLSKRYGSVYRMHSGEVLNLFTSDIEVVVNGVIGIIPQAVSIITKIAAGLIALILIDSSFALIIAVLGLVLAVCGRFYSTRYKKLHKEVQSTGGVVRGFLQECIENIVVIKSFSTHEPVLSRLGGLMSENYRKRIRRNNVSNVASAGLFLLFNCGYYLTLVWGAFQISADLLSYGGLTALLQIVSQIRAPFYNMSGILPAFYSMLASAERLIDLESLDDEPPADPTETGRIYENLRSITAENLAFAYDGSAVISDSAFSIKKGSVAVITGASGGGKSTLFKLLLGLFQPDSGNIFLDCKGEKIPVGAATRPLFAYVPQGNLILSGTIRENISFCRPDAPESDLISATRAAAIYDFIKSLPNGFDTRLSEHGIGLSEGQLQRLAIARALISNAPILLLDECTSALDEETEAALLSNIKQLRTKTAILISHKPSALKICDSRLMIKDGRLYEI